MYGTAISQIIGDALDCFDGLDALFCLTLPGGEFRCIQIKKPPKIFFTEFQFPYYFDQVKVERLPDWPPNWRRSSGREHHTYWWICIMLPLYDCQVVFHTRSPKNVAQTFRRVLGS